MSYVHHALTSWVYMLVVRYTPILVVRAKNYFRVYWKDGVTKLQRIVMFEICSSIRIMQCLFELSFIHFLLYSKRIRLKANTQKSPVSIALPKVIKGRANVWRGVLILS